MHTSFCWPENSVQEVLQAASICRASTHQHPAINLHTEGSRDVSRVGAQLCVVLTRCAGNSQSLAFAALNVLFIVTDRGLTTGVLANQRACAVLISKVLFGPSEKGAKRQKKGEQGCERPISGSVYH